MISWKRPKQILYLFWLDDFRRKQSRGIEYGSAGSSEDLLVNRISNMPSCLLEMGYITNAADNEIFDTCLKKNAKAIAQGIMEFLKEPFDETIYTAY